MNIRTGRVACRSASLDTARLYLRSPARSAARRPGDRRRGHKAVSTMSTGRRRRRRLVHCSTTTPRYGNNILRVANRPDRVTRRPPQKIERGAAVYIVRPRRAASGRPTRARAGTCYLSFAGRRAPHPSPVKLSRKFFRAETSVLEINIDERCSLT